MSILPLTELSPYRAGWTIKGKVSMRGETRTFASKKTVGTNGQVWKMNIVDAHGTEIQASVWDEAATKFDFVKEGGVYTFHRGQVKVAQKQYNTTRHNYEITFGMDTVITPVTDDAALQNVQYNYKFAELREIRNMTAPCFVDLCVMVKSQMPPREIVSKTNKSGVMYLRKLIVVDSSEHSLEFAIFDDERQEENFENQCIVVKRAAIKEYNGRSGSTSAKNIKVNVDLPAVTKLQEWWTKQGKDATVQALSTPGMEGGGGPTTEGTIEELTAVAAKLQVEGLAYFSVLADVSLIRNENKNGEQVKLTYNACETCLKKMQEDGSCVKCNKVVNGVPRFLLTSLKFEDSTTSAWMSAFDEAGTVIFNATAAAVRKFEESRDLVREKANARTHYNQYRLRVKARCEAYNGEAKMKYTVVRCEIADPNEEGKKLLKQLAGMYASLGPASQAEVQALLKGNSKLETLPTGYSQSWENDLRGLTATVA